MKMILQKDDILVHIQQQYSVSFVEKIDPNLDFLADMALFMSNFHDFDKEQIS